jgi:ribosomal protein L29
MKTKNELKSMDNIALKNEAQLLQKEYFNLKLAMITGQVKDISQFKKLRAHVARALTFAQQKQSKAQVK